MAEFRDNDTYTNFTAVSGAQELKYAQDICTLLKQHCYQLQVAWEGATTANASRVQVVEAAGLGHTPSVGLSYGDNLVKAGISGGKSSFATLQAANLKMAMASFIPTGLLSM